MVAISKSQINKLENKITKLRNELTPSPFKRLWTLGRKEAKRLKLYFLEQILAHLNSQASQIAEEKQLDASFFLTSVRQLTDPHNRNLSNVPQEILNSLQPIINSEEATAAVDEYILRLVLNGETQQILHNFEQNFIDPARFQYWTEISYDIAQGQYESKYSYFILYLILKMTSNLANITLKDLEESLTILAVHLHQESLPFELDEEENKLLHETIEFFGPAVNNANDPQVIRRRMQEILGVIASECGLLKDMAYQYQAVKSTDMISGPNLRIQPRY